MAVGRPTKYNQDLQDKADYYAENWSEVDSIPSRVGLCCYIGITKPTMYDWEKLHDQFSTTLEVIDALQEKTAVNKGITGEFNSTITKLVLANHGYSDKQELAHTSPDGSMSPNRIVIEAAGVDSKDISST